VKPITVYDPAKPAPPYPWFLGRGRMVPHLVRAALQLALLPAAVIVALIIWLVIVPILRVKEWSGVRFDQ
jgi:hypothetical protein